MAAQNAKGIKIYLSKGATPGTDVPVTAITITNGKLEVTAATGKAKAGDLVRFGVVGYPGVDNRIFVVEAENGGKYTFKQGLDITDASGNLDSKASMTVFTPGTELINLCLSNIEFSSEAPEAIQVGTYCDPSATIPGATSSAGTVTATGYVDVNGPDYKELLTAAEDGKQRLIEVILPNNGALVAPITISDVSFETPLEGAIGFTATGTLGSKLRHVF